MRRVMKYRIKVIARHRFNNSLFLLKDKKAEQMTVRAGVIYTRDNDVNTPIDSTANPLQIERLWRGHFGLDNTPLNRSKQYLLDIPQWHSVVENEYYYLPFPEFRLAIDSEEPTNLFREHWKHADYPCHLAKAKIRVFYHTTLLQEFTVINFDHRGFFPIPRYYDLSKAREDGRAYIIKEHLETYLCAIASGTKGLWYCDQSAIEENGWKKDIDIHLTNLADEFSIHSLNITLEDTNVNPHYAYRDRQ